MKRRGQSRRAFLGRAAGLTSAGPSLAALLGLLTTNERATATETPPRFRRGINTWPWFSLTKEYPAPRTDYAWPPFQDGRPVPTASDLQRLAAAGFDFIRIPVDPGPFLDAEGNRFDTLLTSLLAAVETALASGLNVIVNVQVNDATHFWNSQTLIASESAPKFAEYRGLVIRIAGALRRYSSSRIALEPVNEPPQSCRSEIWSSVQIALLTAARSTAADLTLIATGSCGSMVSGLESLDPRPLARLEPLLFTFHFYEPYLFSHQGAPWMREPVYRALNQVPWPASAGSLERTLAAVRTRMAADTALSQSDKDAAYAITLRLMREYFEANPDRRFIDRYLDRISLWAKRNHLAVDRILMGEFGALNTIGPYVAAQPEDRIRYVRDVRQSAEDRGFGWAFWNLFDGMGLMDDRRHALDPAGMAALGMTVFP